jgi:NitT/TauT family transport system permease protein
MISKAEPSNAGDNILVWQIALGVGLLGVWAAAGALLGTTWISDPFLVGARLFELAQGDLYIHVGVTFMEVGVGLTLGVLAGAVAGMVLGRSPTTSIILRPIVVALYSVPLVSLAPLLIMFFGLDMAPKIVLVSIVVFFLLLFNTMSGAESVDRDLISALRIMGANRREEFLKVVVPACAAWIMNGIKIATPYALVAAVTGELLAARRGLGFLLTRASSQFDMTGVYTTLFILMIVGLLVSEVATRLEHWLLRWRQSSH